MKDLIRKASILTVFALALGGPTVADALEKRAEYVDLEDDRAWHSSRSGIVVQYYNTCTGWVWVWDGWDPFDVVGQYAAFATYSWAGPLMSSWWFFGEGAPAGYGFTGTTEVWAADENRCPTGAPLASQAFLPESGWNHVSWTGMNAQSSDDTYAVTVTFGAAENNPAEVWTDHPAAGPTGPQACGTCYPSERSVKEGGTQ